MKNLNGEGGATILSSYTGETGSWDINETYKNIFSKNIKDLKMISILMQKILEVRKELIQPDQ